MKVVIQSVEIKDEEIKAVVSCSAKIRDSFDSYTRGEIRNVIIDRLADQLILERGQEILESITNNQMINAVLMKMATKFSDRQ